MNAAPGQTGDSYPGGAARQRPVELTRDECLQRLRPGTSVESSSSRRRCNHWSGRSTMCSTSTRRRWCSGRDGDEAVRAGARRASLFEIDGADPRPGVAWSVIVTGVRGRARHRRRRDSTARRRLGLDTRVTGESEAWLRIRTNVVSGRRLQSAIGRSAARVHIATTRARSVQQPVVLRVGDQVGAALDFDLLMNVRSMGLDGPYAERQ